MFFRHSNADAWLVAAAFAHAAGSALGFVAVAPLGLFHSFAVACGFGVSLCWVANTASHNHIHNPLFRSRAKNRSFSLLLTLLLGFPQSAWRARHLYHHAGEPPGKEPRLLTLQAAIEAALVLVLWLAFARLSARVFLLSYAPGYVLGLLMCELQGRMEHRGGARPERGVSYYGPLYNLLWFNDGHHAEHHLHPSVHWRLLPARRLEFVRRASTLPPHLRFLETDPSSGALSSGLLDWLERIALQSPSIQRFVVHRHETAFRALLSGETSIRRVGIIGGGLFPRTLLVVKRLFPDSEVIVIDHSQKNVGRAREYLARYGREWLGDLVSETGSVRGVSFVVERFSADRCEGLDLLVCPLAYVGDPAEIRRARVSLGFIEHVWAWKAGSRTRMVSFWLLKKLELSLRLP